MSKKLVLILALAIAANAGLWSTVSGALMDTVKPIEYTIDTAGFNPRVYEWQSQTDPGMVCSVIFGNSIKDTTSAQPSMFCWKATSEVLVK